MDAPSTVVDPEPASGDDGDPPTRTELIDDTSDRVILGVAGYVADCLGLDALWVRLAFVLLALAGGVGIVLYLASWLVLFGADRTGLRWVRYIGGAVAVVGVPLMITGGEVDFFDGPIVVVILLIGLALALWQPRRTTAARIPEPRPLPPPGRPSDGIQTPSPVVTDSGQDAIPAIYTTARRRPVRRQRRREPSMLGRTTFGLALIVAAIGALIDQANGGRLHPEQWLGAAALVCGAGLLVGVVRGRAWWLIVPALLFAGAGYVAGLMSRLGIDADEAFGETSLYVTDGNPGGTQSVESVIGSIWIHVDGAPDAPLTIDARAAIGAVELNVADDVSIEIRSESDHGDLVVNDTVVPSGVTRLGPDRPPDVIVDALQGIGDVDVRTYDPDAQFRERLPDIPVGDTVVPSVGVDPTVPEAPTPTAAPPAPTPTTGG